MHSALARQYIYWRLCVTVLDHMMYSSFSSWTHFHQEFKTGRSAFTAYSNYVKNISCLLSSVCKKYYSSYFVLDSKFSSMNCNFFFCAMHANKWKVFTFSIALVDHPKRSWVFFTPCICYAAAPTNSTEEILKRRRKGSPGVWTI